MTHSVQFLGWHYIKAIIFVWRFTKPSRLSLTGVVSSPLSTLSSSKVHEIGSIRYYFGTKWRNSEIKKHTMNKRNKIRSLLALMHAKQKASKRCLLLFMTLSYSPNWSCAKLHMICMQSTLTTWNWKLINAKQMNIDHTILIIGPKSFNTFLNLNFTLDQRYNRFARTDDRPGLLSFASFFLFFFLSFFLRREHWQNAFISCNERTSTQCYLYIWSAMMSFFPNGECQMPAVAIYFWALLCRFNVLVCDLSLWQTLQFILGVFLFIDASVAVFIWPLVESSVHKLHLIVDGWFWVRANALLNLNYGACERHSCGTIIHLKNVCSYPFSHTRKLHTSKCVAIVSHFRLQ